KKWRVHASSGSHGFDNASPRGRLHVICGSVPRRRWHRRGRGNGPMTDYDPAAYGDAWVRDYDQLYQSRDDPEMVVAALSPLVTGRAVLEMGIGTGRLALPLHDAGWHVVGIEASAAVIAELQRRAAGRSIPVHQGDIRSFHLDDRFDVVLLAFSTLFLLPD